MHFTGTSLIALARDMETRGGGGPSGQILPWAYQPPQPLRARPHWDVTTKAEPAHPNFTVGPMPRVGPKQRACVPSRMQTGTSAAARAREDVMARRAEALRNEPSAARRAEAERAWRKGDQLPTRPARPFSFGVEPYSAQPSTINACSASASTMGYAEERTRGRGGPVEQWRAGQRHNSRPATSSRRPETGRTSPVTVNANSARPVLGGETQRGFTQSGGTPRPRVFTDRHGITTITKEVCLDSGAEVSR
jgi:hypothetical protein